MPKKKLLLIAVLALCVCLAAGCGAKPSAQGTDKARLSLREAVEKAAADAAGLTGLTADDLSDVLGIEPEEYTEFVYLQGDGLDGREILALRAADAAAAAHLKEQLDGYLEQRRRETQNYLPEVYQLLSKASVAVKGTTVALFVGADAARETDALLAGE